VDISAGRRVRDTGRCPTVRNWIVSSTCIEKKRRSNTFSAPYNHFTASPYCREIPSAVRCVGGAGSYPIICRRIISATSVQKPHVAISTPDDHFSASPHCCVIDAAIRRVGGAGGYPVIVDASIRPIRYSGKGILTTRRWQ
jgi:hypothetical protein